MTGAGLSDYDMAYKKTTGRPVGTIPLSALQTAQPSSVQTPVSAIGLVAGATAQPKTADSVSGAESYGTVSIDKEHINRTRETTDALWKLNEYIFIDCECDTNLKIPQVYVNKVIDCPHCLKSHRVVQA